MLWTRATPLALAAILVAMLAASAPAPAITYPSGFEEREVVGGLSLPMAAAWAPDGRLFVAEKEGRLKVVPQGGTTATTILDISDRVNAYQDRGLLGLAVDPDFASNGYVYLLYTYELSPLIADGNGEMVSRLGRFTVGEDNSVSAETVLLGSYVAGPCPPARNDLDCIPSDYDSHSIGTVRAAPDGTLWLGSGDASNYNIVDTRAFRSYDVTGMAGKILHVDRDGNGLPGHPHCPANDDLTDVCTKVHSSGFRNPFRFALRPGGGLVVGDVGWRNREEVDLISVPGRAYGWPCYEGTTRTPGYDGRAECAPEYSKEGTAGAHVPPQHDYQHAGDSAVIGGPEYAGSHYPAGYQGDVFFGDYAAGFVKKLNLAPGGTVTGVEEFATGWSGVDLTSTPDGDLAYVSFGDGSPGTGSVRKVVYTPGNLSPGAAITASATSGPPPLAVQFTGSNSTDPDGDALSYRWDFGDGSPLSTERDPSHTYDTAGNYTARLTVSDGRGLSGTETVTIAVGGAPPVAHIDSPPSGGRYRAGQTVELSGSASDPQDGALPASAMSWTVRLYHGSHIHIVRQVDGQATPSFVVQDDHDADSHYEITLTVTDSGGLRGSHTIRLDPETVDLRLESSPPGAALSYSGATLTAPGSFTSGVGYRTTVGAVQQFASGGRDYVFDGWSDGGARQHDIVIPASDTTLTAHYRDAGPSRTAGLVAAYAFDEGTGAAVADASGSGNTGAVSGASWSAAGRHGTALSFDGADDWVTVADSASLDLSGAMTLEAWVKPDEVSRPWRSLILKEASGDQAYGLYATGNVLRPNAWWGDSAFVYGSASIPAGAWSHLAVTSDGTTMRIYVDGIQVGSSAVSGALPASDGPLRIGGNAVWAGEFFGGSIDDVRVYGRALSADEIQADRDTAVSGATLDATPPHVSISEPAQGATVSGTVDVAANVSDDVGVARVQFRLDGQDLGAPDTSAPYGVSWDTGAVAHGTHRLVAVARDHAGNERTSQEVTVTVRESVSRAGLVAAYAFDEGGGSAAADASGSGNSAVVSGAAWSAAGRHGTALSFDGVDDWVTVADSASLDLSGAMTLEAWVKPTSVSRPWQPVVLKEAVGDQSYALYATGSLTRPNAWWGSDSPVYGAPLAAGTWSHLAVSSDGVTMRLFVDGEEAASAPVTGLLPASSGPLRIGGNDIWAGEFFAGAIDDVRVYSRALSAAEIQLDGETPVGSGGGSPPPDGTPPTVSVTAPAPGAELSETVQVTASAADDVGVDQVQFKLDGQDLGSPDTSAPFAVTWDTRGTPDGPHTLTAVARDGAGNTGTAADVAVTVLNSAAPAGLVAAFGFDEGSGTAVADSSGSGNAGVVSGATWLAAGRFGKALDFDGVNDWVTVADSASLDLSGPMTLAAWVKPDTVTKKWQSILLKEALGTQSYALYATAANSRPNAWWGGDTGVFGSAGLSAGAWTHLAASSNGSTMRLYVNGAEVGSVAVSGSIPASAGPLRIGGNAVWPGEFFDGAIDELRVYDRALGQAEIQEDSTTPVNR